MSHFIFLYFLFFTQIQSLKEQLMVQTAMNMNMNMNIASKPAVDAGSKEITSEKVSYYTSISVVYSIQFCLTHIASILLATSCVLKSY